MIMIEQCLYADRKDKIKEAMELLLDERKKFLCYSGEPGYGITAFFHRLEYLLQSTNNIICLSAELSENSKSVLHEIVKHLVIKKGDLYHAMQLFTDEHYGEQEQTLVKSIVLDLPYGETMSHLFFDQPAAQSIYTGYYSDILKQNFFELLKRGCIDKRIIIFIDNTQYIDNNSISDIIALLKHHEVTIVLSRTENSSTLEKLLLEIYGHTSCDEVANLDFPEPPIECVTEICKNNGRVLTVREAELLIHKTNGDMRKIICSAKHETFDCLDYRDLLSTEILNLMHIIQEVSFSGITAMIENSPTCCFVEETKIRSTLQMLKQRGFLNSFYRIDREEIFRARMRGENQAVWDSLMQNPADNLIYQDIVYRYVSSMEKHSFEELKLLFELSQKVDEHKRSYWGKKLLMESLKCGTLIQVDWIQAVRELPDDENQFLCAISLFKICKYQGAYQILKSLWPRIASIRDAKILYALTLNRCRMHEDANRLLWELIDSSTQTDEKTMLLAISISNYIHWGNENLAKKILSDYEADVIHSKMYGYFLRNAATLFQGNHALQYWEKALHAFQHAADEYGKITTVVNMARVYIQTGKIVFARGQLEDAYEKLLPYGVEQLHIVLNNLGVACIACDDIPNARKHLRVARLIAKSIMPRTYITINDCCAMLARGEKTQAFEALIEMKKEIDDHNKHHLPRLRRRFYLALSGLLCIMGKYEKSLEALDIAEQLFSPENFAATRSRIRKKCISNIPPEILDWKEYFPYAFLEYWITNPLSVMSHDALPC